MPSSGIEQLRILLPNCLRRDQRRFASELERVLDPATDPVTARRHLDRLLQQAHKSIALRHRRHEMVPTVNYPESLPIVARKTEIIDALRAHPVVVIAGETGSGKTTQLPKMCLEAGFGVEGKIGCTQPRRVAALSVSRRIADELGVRWGDAVGCKIRFRDQSKPETYIKLMTDGILLAETHGDRDLTEYEVIVIDEAHERSLNIDFLLGHLRLLLGRRSDLKVIITSATIDVEAFSLAFNHAPIIQVSGRTFPVEIRYAPYDTDENTDAGDGNYVDAAVATVEEIMETTYEGDILVFMPGERDIRETSDAVQGRYGRQAEVVSLFGRLSGGEQERAFAPSARRKVIVATNIAETSLTIPGIRYVVDAGLARMSRYSPRTRTKRLPIEPISQSSANQRAGRSGRVADGVCIRLYSEEEFAGRPQFTQPEIQRSNLAEVILRLKAWELGEIETFPFLNPPSPQAIAAGYQLLTELNALDATGNLTALGRNLARLPVDPSIGRMILQSVHEHVLEEVLIIAAGLSIQDPRERPQARQMEADQAHRRFIHPASDFLTLLNIWHAFHRRWEELRTQSQLRGFCQAHFLSYVRMREWGDVHAELSDIIEQLQDRLRSPAPRVKPNEEETYAAIHRSILAGLLGHVGQKIETNVYRGAANRQAMVFPGSSLFVRPGAAGGSAESGPKTAQPEWIVAGEIVETNRLYARTVARLSPEWIIEVGDHICKRTYSEAHWDQPAGRVLVRERVTLFGLTVKEGNVDFGRVDPPQATEIFIRAALVVGQIELPHRFLKHNQDLKQRIDAARTRRHGSQAPATDETLYEFYAARLQGISSVHDLNRVVREGGKNDPKFLCAIESELTGGIDLGWDEKAYPPRVSVAGQSVAVTYAYARGEENDGVTISVPAVLGHQLSQDQLDFVIPGLREEQVEHLLKALPKPVRVALMPIPPKVKELASLLDGSQGLEQLAELVRQRYQVKIPSDSWQRALLPPYLRPRVVLTNPAGKAVATGRDLEQLKKELQKHETPSEQQAWQLAVQRWEKYDLSKWNFPPLPERLEVTNVAGTPLLAFPGLVQEIDRVNLKLFRSRDEAERATGPAIVRLGELELERELAWLQKDLRVLNEVKDLYATLGPAAELLETTYLCLRRHLLQPMGTLLPLDEAAFKAMLEKARSQMGTVAAPLITWIREILRLRQQLLLARQPYPGLTTDLDRLLPRRFLASTDYAQLQHLPRYLKAMTIRNERATLNRARDKEKAQAIEPYAEAVRAFASGAQRSLAAQQAWEELRWMVEEYRISVFAQEMGTIRPVSAKRLEAQVAVVKGLI